MRLEVTHIKNENDANVNSIKSAHQQQVMALRAEHDRLSSELHEEQQRKARDSAERHAELQAKYEGGSYVSFSCLFVLYSFFTQR